MGFLDYIGLSQYTDKFEAFITDKVAKLLETKQNSLMPGEGVSLESDTISVTTPVKGVTQAEYDALSEAEKNIGLFVVTDASINLNDRGDVYSTEETRIGTWIDGKPIYRKVFVFTSPSTSALTIVLTLENFYIIHIDGFVETDVGPRAVTFFGGTSYFISVSQDQNGAVSMMCTSQSYQNKPTKLILEYTKTTDPTPTTQTTLLTSKVDLPQTMTLSSPSDSPVTVTFPSSAAIASASASASSAHFPYFVASASAS